MVSLRWFFREEDCPRAGARIALRGGCLLVVKNEFSHEHDQ